LIVVTHEAGIASDFERRVGFVELNRALAAQGGPT
jgi:hypothetical protein